MLTRELVRGYRFFRSQGCRAEGALHLARAEELLERAVDAGVASVEWLDDPEPYDCGDACTEDEARARFDSNEWTGPYGCVLRIDGETAGSLWGIVVGQWGTADPYCRLIAAELAWEVEDDLRQAVGDRLDVTLLSSVRQASAVGV